jgi:hypothetical protein
MNDPRDPGLHARCHRIRSCPAQPTTPEPHSAPGTAIWPPVAVPGQPGHHTPQAAPAAGDRATDLVPADQPAEEAVADRTSIWSRWRSCWLLPKDSALAYTQR